MATFSSPSSSPPPTPSRRKLRTCARRCERACCTVATYFPLAFVFSLATWAVWVEGNIGLGDTGSKDVTRPVKASSMVGIFLYFMLNTCYVVAVFTDPGSPSNPTDSGKKGGKYSILPTSEPGHDVDSFQNITVSSRGSARYCKKCHTPKPDRTHHCSSCKRCVLKMDHHCPWLATCLGLHNYKAFVLFLIYNCLFCWVCFGSSAWWMYTNLLIAHYVEEYAPVNIIMLSLISGIVGLVLTGFTSWHLYLCVRGQTTIECLEKTRYLSSVRERVEQNRQDHNHSQTQHHRTNSDSMAATIQRAGEQLLEFHANAVPGATRYEEGEEHTSPTPTFRSTHPLPPATSSQTRPNNITALQSLRQNYSTAEAARERARYDEYLEDKETEKLPNAFDLGWKRNLSHLFGPNALLWFLPICNTTGDGWRWEVSEKWRIAHEEMVRRKEERLKLAQQNSTGNVGMRGGGGAYDYAEYEQDRSQLQFDYDYNNDYNYEQDRDEEYHLDSTRHPPHARRYRSPNNQYQQQHRTNEQRRPHHSPDGMIMQTLNPNNRPDQDRGRHGATSPTSIVPDTQPLSQHQKRKHRREFSRNQDGEMDTFEVSGSDDSGDDER